MKHIKILAALSVCMISFLTGSFHADALIYGGIAEYTIRENEVIITGCSGDPEKLVLPSEIDGKPVTEIRENAFFRCKTLKSITVPESVRRIGHHAFYHCEKLEAAEISAAITDIEDGVFYGCCALSYISLPDSVQRINQYAFYGCENLTDAEPPVSLSWIDEYAFYGSKLNRSSFSNVSYVSENAFSPDEVPASAKPSGIILPVQAVLRSIFCIFLIIIIRIKSMKYINYEKKHSN
ncbi:MAG: leucine-rich repeat domain-containing protein [Porcipelethomonas sp.]